LAERSPDEPANDNPDDTNNRDTSEHTFVSTTSSIGPYRSPFLNAPLVHIGQLLIRGL
jgi:hypothetical protein